MPMYVYDAQNLRKKECQYYSELENGSALLITLAAELNVCIVAEVYCY